MAVEISVTIGAVSFNTSFTPGATMYLLKNTEEILGALSTRRSDTQKQGAHGVEASQSQYDPRILRFQGEIHATSQSQRVSMQQALDAALALPRLQSYDGDDGFKLVLITDEDGVQKQLYAVVTQMPEYGLIETGMPESRTFRFEMFCPDPEIFAQDLTTEQGVEAFNTTTFTFQDGDLPTFQDDDLPGVQDVIGSFLTVTNGGNYPTPLLFTITGPTENPVLRNLTTGKSISFTRNGGVSLEAGETLTINTASSTAVKTVSGVDTNVRSKVSLDSIFFDLVAGDNDLALFDDTPGDLAGGMEAQFRYAWL